MRLKLNGVADSTYVTQSIDERVLESELPHKIVNLTFTTNFNNKLTVLWGELTYENPFINPLCEMKPVAPAPRGSASLSGT